MKTLLKECKNKKPRYVYDNKDATRYCTNYDLLDSDGNLIYQERKSSCFKSIFLRYSEHYSKLKFNEGRVLRVYALSTHTRLNEKEVKRYVRLLRGLNIPFDFKVVNNLDLNIEPATKVKTVDCFPRQRVYVLEVKLDNISFTALKFLVYHFRYIYEMNSDLIIRYSLKYKDKFKSYSIFQIIPFMDGKYRVQFDGFFGHRVFYYYTTGITLSELRNKLKKTASLDDLTESFPRYAYKFYSSWGGYLTDISRTPMFDENMSIKQFCKYLKSVESVYEF